MSQTNAPKIPEQDKISEKLLDLIIEKEYAEQRLVELTNQVSQLKVACKQEKSRISV